MIRLLSASAAGSPPLPDVEGRSERPLLGGAHSCDDRGRCGDKGCRGRQGAANGFGVRLLPTPRTPTPPAPKLAFSIPLVKCIFQSSLRNSLSFLASHPVQSFSNPYKHLGIGIRGGRYFWWRCTKEHNLVLACKEGHVTLQPSDSGGWGQNLFDSVQVVANVGLITVWWKLCCHGVDYALA